MLYLDEKYFMKNMKNQITSHFPFPVQVLFKFCGHFSHLGPYESVGQQVFIVFMHKCEYNSDLMLFCLFLNQSNK